MRVFLFLLSFQVSAQQLFISGKIMDDETGAPVPFASVFLGSTSLGATANENGIFRIAKVPAGEFDLIISSVGYEPSSVHVVVKGSIDVPVRISKKTTELDEVTVQADTSGWKINYEVFTEIFLGRTQNARQCKILNPRDLIFFYDPNEGFYAHSKNPLIIENKALGYRITYYLQQFEKNNRNGMQYVLGIPLFEEIKPKNKFQEKRIANARNKAFEGSLMHFFRSLYEHNLDSEGFAVYENFKVPNRNKPPKDLIQAKVEQFVNGNRDSLRYYSRLNSLPDKVDSIGRKFSRGSELLRDSLNPSTISFAGQLRIIYRREKEEPAYIMFGNRPPMEQQSLLHFVNPGAKVYASGHYEDPEEVLLDGYLGWSEKIAEMLPLDYMPPPK